MRLAGRRCNRQLYMQAQAVAAGAGTLMGGDKPLKAMAKALEIEPVTGADGVPSGLRDLMMQAVAARRAANQKRSG